MEFFLIQFIQQFLFPPGFMLLLMSVGVLLLRYYYRTGVGLIVCGLALLYLTSTSLVASGLAHVLQSYPALSSEALAQNRAQAIVVLAAGRTYNTPEFGADITGPFSLQRIRYAAWLKRRTHLPLYASGGRLYGEDKAEAELMQEALQREFNVEVNKIETLSRTTYENALYTSQLLRQDNIQRIFLVTHAFHMPRAAEAFEHFGIEVIPASTVYLYADPAKLALIDFVPNASSMHKTAYFIHEIVGLLWYRLRYY